MLKIYNTLSKEIEPFIPKNEKEVTMYTCGPTVYHYAHIGNLRTYIFEDILEKSLIYLGYNVKRVMNITDVGHLENDSDVGEDKIAKEAEKEKKSVYEIAEFYTKAFLNDAEKLNIKIPNILEKASDHIDIYITIIEDLLNKSYAYESNGNIYFDVSKIDNYYELSGKKENDLLSAVRDDVEVDSNKKNLGDFALWFTSSKFKNQIMKWESPFGIGYPGWHIECTGIAIEYLGEYLDIHCGGVDNIFPHHTNEIAQSESYLSHKWCNYFMHGEHLNDLDGKMSKSKGTIMTVSKLIQDGYDPVIYRFYCLMSHYRKLLTFSYSNLDTAKISYDSLKNKINNLDISNNNLNNEVFDTYNEKFKSFLENDLNTANTITLIYDVLKDDCDDYTKYKLIEEFDKVLSLNLTIKKEIDAKLLEYANEMIEKRNEAKKNKNYELADAIRNELFLKNIFIKDTKDGTMIITK